MTAVQVSVETKSAHPESMYLRTQVGTATMPDGREVELSMSGASIILTLGKFEGNDAHGRSVYIMTWTDLGEAWMHAIDEAGL